jgi:sphingolipid delta-4 desaturase
MSGPVDTDGHDIKGLAQETTSYYGWLNILCYNVSSVLVFLPVIAHVCSQVGYHNEHHDFPSVPWTRLPELRKIAHDFYDPLPAHKSWPMVTWKFITDPSVGMWCRAKRTSKGERLEPEVWVTESEVSESEGEDVVYKGMAEAVERGYGSDGEEVVRRKKME